MKHQFIVTIEHEDPRIAKFILLTAIERHGAYFLTRAGKTETDDNPEWVHAWRENGYALKGATVDEYKGGKK